VIPAIKKSAENSGLEPDNQILLLLEYSLRLAPSYEGVVVASSILCISTTLNKRKQYGIFLSCNVIKIHPGKSDVNIH
jgi:hypothetical protein